LNSPLLYVKKQNMKNFFKVQSLSRVMTYLPAFSIQDVLEVPLAEALDRILALDIESDIDIPDFRRSTMDGYAVMAKSTFGASEENPAYITVRGNIGMGETPSFIIGIGEAAGISTGGMLPEGADAVVMVEHTEVLDAETIEVYKSSAPGQNMIDVGEDYKKGEPVLGRGKRSGPRKSECWRQWEEKPCRYSAGQWWGSSLPEMKSFPCPKCPVRDASGTSIPIPLMPLCETQGPFRECTALSGTIRRRSPVPSRRPSLKTTWFSSPEGVPWERGDYTISALTSLPDSDILVHGISISPGKPTILAKIQGKPVWGLPGHVVSAMVVFSIVVRPFIEQISGRKADGENQWRIPAILTRNLASAQGRTDFVRVKLSRQNEMLVADPILGKSGLINTLIKADGLIEINENHEGLDKGSRVDVIPI
jgi:molybdopterin molybdotransferase